MRKFLIALPNNTPIFTVGVPDLCSKEATTVTTDDFCRENIISAEFTSQLFAFRHFCLYQFKFLWGDNGRMAFLNIILGYFTLIYFGLFREKIHSKFLLQQSRTFVFFVGQDTPNRSYMPLFFSGRRWNTTVGQIFCNCIVGFSL